MLGNTFKKVISIFKPQSNNFCPHTVYIELTDKCNMSCPMCMTKYYRNNLHDSSLTKDQIFKLILRPAKYYGFKTVMFTGGEPTLRDDLLEILKEAICLGFQIYFATNLLNFNEHLYTEILGLLQEAKHGIQVSFDSLNKDEMNKIRGKDVYTQVLQNSRKIVQLYNKSSSNCSLCANITIQEENHESILRTIDFVLNDIGFKYVSLQPRHDYSAITSENFKNQPLPSYVLKNESKLISLTEELFDKADHDKRIYIHGGSKQNWKDFFGANSEIQKTCRSKDMIFVDTYGNLRGCVCGKNIVNIKDTPLSKYLISKDYKAFLKFSDSCKLCVHGCS